MRILFVIAICFCISHVYAQGGNLPVIEVQENGGLDFGDQYAGYASQPLSLHISNAGPVNLEIYDVFVEQSCFQIPNIDFPLIIPGGENYSMAVIFQPQATGAVQDTMYIINNDPQRKEYPVLVKGRGLAVPFPEVNNLQITVSGDDVVLLWDPVNTNIFGDAAVPDRYVIEFSQYPSGPYFWPLAVVPGCSFTHDRAILYAPARFYRVKAIDL